MKKFDVNIFTFSKGWIHTWRLSNSIFSWLELYFRFRFMQNSQSSDDIVGEMIYVRGKYSNFCSDISLLFWFECFINLVMNFQSTSLKCNEIHSNSRQLIFVWCRNGMNLAFNKVLEHSIQSVVSIILENLAQRTETELVFEMRHQLNRLNSLNEYHTHFTSHVFFHFI